MTTRMEQLLNLAPATLYDFKTYATGSGTHSYDVECERADERMTFNVWATNRTQAANRVKRDGWEVRSVNMTG